MAKWVIKRGGKKAHFSAAKFKSSIKDACKEVCVPSKRIKTVVNKVARPVLKFAAKRTTVKTMVLRKKALAGLAKMEPKAAKAWRKYDTRRRARRRRR